MKKIGLVLLTITACAGDAGNIKEIAQTGLKEASALEYAGGTLWALEDQGNKSVLYGMDSKGNVASEVFINAENNDWESLASDAEGNLYIGDFGNNENNRKDLAIYKIDAARLKASETGVSSRISFSYPEQKGFPPSKSERLFDCEAFIEHNGYFYLFTKNRSPKSDGTFYVYSVPNKSGNYKARLLAELKTCSKGPCAVTGADISPDGKAIVLLTADTVYTIENFSDNDFDRVGITALYLAHSSQKEGICFKNNSTVLIIDEQNKNWGGKIYEASLDELKAKG